MEILNEIKYFIIKEKTLKKDFDKRNLLRKIDESFNRQHFRLVLFSYLSFLMFCYILVASRYGIEHLIFGLVGMICSLIEVYLAYKTSFLKIYFILTKQQVLKHLKIQNIIERLDTAKKYLILNQINDYEYKKIPLRESKRYQYIFDCNFFYRIVNIGPQKDLYFFPTFVLYKNDRLFEIYSIKNVHILLDKVNVLEPRDGTDDAYVGDAPSKNLLKNTTITNLDNYYLKRYTKVTLKLEKKIIELLIDDNFNMEEEI